MSVSGRVATILIIGASAGEMALPALAGGLFAHDPLSLPWFILLSCMVQCMFYYCLAGRTAEAVAARDLQVLQSQGDCALFGEKPSRGGGGGSAAGPCEGTGVPAACTKAGAAKPSADDEDASGIAML